MKHTEAVNKLDGYFEDEKLPPGIRDALAYLIANARNVENMAYYIIGEIDNGALNAWVDYREEFGADDVYLDEQRLFGHEEDAYESAHAILGEEVAWPKGYYKNEEEE